MCDVKHVSFIDVSEEKKELDAFCSSSCGEKTSAAEVLWPRRYRFDVLILFSAALSPQAAYVHFLD